MILVGFKKQWDCSTMCNTKLRLWTGKAVNTNIDMDLVPTTRRKKMVN
jgi:hypothetical protein